MKIRKKNALIAATAAFAVAFAAGGAALKLNVNADEAESEILTIRQGASVRISENYAQNGIRYELNMQKKRLRRFERIESECRFRYVHRTR